MLYLTSLSAAVSFIPKNAGKVIAKRIAMIAITTTVSIREKP